MFHTVTLPVVFYSVSLTQPHKVTEYIYPNTVLEYFLFSI